MQRKQLRRLSKKRQRAHEVLTAGRKWEADEEEARSRVEEGEAGGKSDDRTKRLD
jgi:hypothetical protein